MQFDIETMKEFQIGNSIDPNQMLDGEKELGEDTKDLPIHVEVYLKQSKRRIYFKKCKGIFNAELEYQKSISELSDTEENISYGPNFARYVLNVWDSSNVD